MIVSGAQEPVLAPGVYGWIRSLFIYLRMNGANNEALDRQVETLPRVGQPVLTFALRHQHDLGAEFFRWEYSTAVAGHLLGIQPFEQPNVQESKDNARRVLDSFQATGRLHEAAVSKPDHPNSSYGLALETLFRRSGIRSSQVHRMKGEFADLRLAASEYERTVRGLKHSPSMAIPRFDLVLLGLGEDGHTASPFPETPALSERNYLVAVGLPPDGISSRLTLILGVISPATVVLFLVTGAGKEQTVRAILPSQTQAERALPAAQVKPDSGRLLWLLDDAAAAALTR